MTDLRVLAMSLMGWFLALAIGLLLGSSLGTPDRRDRAYEGLRREFELLRTENQRVQEESAANRRQADAGDQALQDLMPELLADRLDGMQIGLVVCGSDSESLLDGGLAAVLRSAGAEVGPVLRIPDRLRSIPAADRVRFGAYFGSGNVPDEPIPYEGALWAMRGMAAGLPLKRVKELADAVGLGLQGYSGRPLRRVILLTGGDEDRAQAVRLAETPEIRLVDLARDAGIRLVAAEREESRPVVQALHRRGIPCVDNIDRAAGRISVVLALAGADGSFGSKPGAGRAIPAIPIDAASPSPQQAQPDGSGQG